MSRCYGTAELKDGVWRVEAEPHVMMRLRRWFKRGGRQYGAIELSHTEEVCRDLVWFTERFPLDIRPLSALKSGAASFDDRQREFAQVLAGEIEPRRFEMAIPPRRYQTVAAELAMRSPGLLVADDLGLGKTCTAIATLADPETRPALVVTLTHLPRQWRHELARFVPDLRVHLITKGTPYELAGANGHARQIRLFEPGAAAPRFPDVLICNYHKLQGWAEALAGKIRTLIFDECQELRRDASHRYAAARLLAAQCSRRIGLSATPIYNYGPEAFNVFEVLRPGALGTRTEFLDEWCDGGGAKAGIVDPKAFGVYLRESGLMIRRTRSEVGRELPALTKSIVYVDADERQVERVAADVTELARLLLRENTGWKERGDAARDLDWRLRQATGIAKAPFVASFVRLLVESGEQVVLYGWHREVYAIWAKLLASCSPAFYTGTESVVQKEESKRKFCDGSARVLVMSLRSGAGLDGLQHHCRTVVHGELDWSPAVHEQGTGRVHRDGQGDPVVAYFLVSETGSDPAVIDVLGIKREQIDGIRDPLVEPFQAISKSDAIEELARSFLAQRGLSC